MSATQATEQARTRVRDEVDRRSTEAGEQATSVADAIRQSAQHLREQGKDTAAKPMEQAAQRVERAGSWLQESDGDRILRDVEDFGRRQPMVVIAGGIAVGFALSRLMKASSSRRYAPAPPAASEPYSPPPAGNPYSPPPPAGDPYSPPPPGGPGGL